MIDPKRYPQLSRVLAARDLGYDYGMEPKIKALMDQNPGMTRAQAAQKLLDLQPRWYCQTTEGEYLEKVVQDPS